MISTYRRMIRAAGSQAHMLKRAVRLVILSAIVQGIAYGMLFPLFRSLLTPDGEGLLLYADILIGFIVLDGILRLIILKDDWETQMLTGHEARLRLGEQLRRMPLEYLNSRQAGDLNVVLSGDVNDLVMIMGGLYNMVLYTIIAPVTTIVITLFVDWRLALMLIVLFPLATPFYQRIRNIAARENRVTSAATALVTANLIEYAQGLGVLRATRQVGTQSVRLQNSLAHLRRQQTMAANWNIAPGIMIATVVQMGILVVTAIGVVWILGGGLSVAIMLALLAIMVRFAEPLSHFANIASMFDFMEAALERIDVLSSVEPLPVKTPHGQIESFDITFDRVDFVYEAGVAEMNGDRVLRDISFTLPERSLTALVGPSGSGKTTITKLITRYADPQKGSVNIGGVDIRSVTPETLMHHISVVFQDVYLFDDSIRNNIRMAKPDATDAEVEAAAEAANCHEFITRLPQGYDTTVGEIGGSLSGGERQRISIARAILKDAPIVLLDEPTSALDTESEVAVQRAIDKLVENKTVVVIAHRLSTVVAADMILVLEDGRIVEQGKHDALLSGNGRYAAMWNAQQQARRWKV